MTGAATIEQANQLKLNIKRSLSDYGFNLRKLRSNSTEIVSSDKDSCASAPKAKVIDNDTDHGKILGLVWNSHSDFFGFNVELQPLKIHTKRTLLSESSKVFDPLGLLSPLTVRIKILFQELWSDPITWDDALPDRVLNQWLQIRGSLVKIKEIEIPRWLGTTTYAELHGFSDASTKAYAAAIYAVVSTGMTTTSTLIIAKTKVAPIKPTTLARLELQAACLLSSLMKFVEKTLNFNIGRKVFWTDSVIVLDWLSSHPKRWKVFVSNRCAQILETDKHHRNLWKYVPSADNAVDCASRGMSLSEMQLCKSWWVGPEWLCATEDKWPILEKHPNKSSIEECITGVFLTTKNDYIEQYFQKFNSLYRASLTYVLVYKYVARWKAKAKNLVTEPVQVSPSEINAATITLCRHNQQNTFTEEYNMLTKGQMVLKRSSLRTLNPFVSDDGLIRVGGRIQESSGSFNAKHPIILAAGSPLAKMIISDYHILYGHAGINLCNALIKKKYWIIRGKTMVRSKIRGCVTCARANPRLEQQLMGNLPRDRVQFKHAFASVGVDYCGPFEVHVTRRRGAVPTKSYVCIFVCLATKAVHFETVGSLTKEGFIGALQRFISRRGICSAIYSDNGTNFVGAHNYLQDLFKFLETNNHEISRFLLRHKIQWSFIPPGSPHMGGLWEAAVKLLKTNLRKVMGSHILQLEEFQTVIVKIEGAVNSRPLCADETDDLNAITPGHFLIGRALTDLPEIDPGQLQQPFAAHWRTVRSIYAEFWRKWHLGYVSTLQRRTKWQQAYTNIKVGDVVLLADAKASSCCWPLARVLQLHHGKDGVVRVVTVKVGRSSLITKRTVHQICKLPVIDELNRTDSRPGSVEFNRN